MSRSPNNEMDCAFYRAVFDAMPLPLLVFSNQLEVLQCNQAAAQATGTDPGNLLGQRLGAALGCIHPCQPDATGAWPEACAECVLRQALEAAFRKESVSRQWARLERQVASQRIQASLQVACQPIQHPGQPLALLILDGLNT